MLGLDASRFELSMIILSFDASWPGRMRLYQEHTMCSSHTKTRGLEPWLARATGAWPEPFARKWRFWRE